jgi:hypothetical protein
MDWGKHNIIDTPCGRNITNVTGPVIKSAGFKIDVGWAYL